MRDFERLTILSVFVLLPLMFFQDIDRPVAITSPPLCPVVLSGVVHGPDIDVAKSQYSYTAQMTSENESNKSIMLLIYRFELLVATDESTSEMPPKISPERSVTRIEDFFFSRTLLEPGATTSAKLQLVPYDLNRDRQVPLTRISPTSKILFVQFSDGTWWGDSEVAQQPLAERGEALKYLQHLLEIHRRFGELGLASELRAPSNLTVAAILKQIYGGGDSRPVLDRAREMLAAGEAHSVKNAR